MKKDRSKPESHSSEYYFMETAAAFVRGSKDRGEAIPLPDRLFETPLAELSEADKSDVIRIGQESELHLINF